MGLGWLDALSGKTPIVVTGAELTLRTPVVSDYEAWAALRRTSREFLTPFEPLWAEDDLERAAFRRRLERYRKDQAAETGYSFLVFRSRDATLLGGLSLSNVRRGVMQACSMGYWVGQPHAGKGVMSAAVRQILPFVFDDLGLHRLEAACLPHNAPSVRLLEKAGFVREGYARRYLCIAGAWQDHLLFALMAEDWQSRKLAGPSGEAPGLITARLSQDLAR